MRFQIYRHMTIRITVNTIVLQLLYTIIYQQTIVIRSLMDLIEILFMEANHRIYGPQMRIRGINGNIMNYLREFEIETQVIIGFFRG